MGGGAAVVAVVVAAVGLSLPKHLGAMAAVRMELLSSSEFNLCN